VIRFLAFLAITLALFAGIDESLILPSGDPKIEYASGPLTDRATSLDAKLRSGAAELAYQPDFGYLVSLLRALDVPVASQVLVFSKTSFQAPRISPRTPRALYHSADVSVGFVHGGDVLEIAAVDPRQGVVFYTLDQEESARPRLVRRDECMQCHLGTSTLGVPGLVVRSVHADRNGTALLAAKAYVTDHRSPLDQRWGGWYVTGLSGTQHHMGNQTVGDPAHPAYDPEAGTNLRTLDGLIDTGAYLAPDSDIVSLMLLEHQTRFTNLVTRLGWESRLGRSLDATAAELVYFNKAKLGLNDPAKTLRELLSALAMLGLAATVVIVASASGSTGSGRSLIRALSQPWSRRVLLIAGASAAALFLNRLLYHTRWDVSPFRALPVLCLVPIYGYLTRTDSAQSADAQRRSLFVVSVYSLAVLGRVILRVPSGGAYGAYLLPVPLLLFTHLATRFYRPVLGTSPAAALRARRTVFALLIIGLTGASAVIAYRYVRADYVPLETARGRAKLAPSDAAAYAGALDFIARRTRPGEYVAAMPEGSSLNFLADRPAPLRYEILTPGFLTADGERRAIAQLQAKRVTLILLLNRPTREFGCPAFGRDCYRILGRWIDDNYQPTAVFGARASLASQIGDTPFFIKALEAATP
jgi:hypothetical protein